MLADVSVPDAVLVARVRAGDRDAFTQIYAEHCDALCRSIGRLLGSREAAEDVVHTVFLEIWERRTRWHVSGSIRRYVFGAVRKAALTQLRRDITRERLALRGRGDVSEADVTDAAFAAEELHAQFVRVLATLPPRAREAFMLQRRDGLPYTEVAVRMGISAATVRAHVAHCLAVLRKAMAVVILLGMVSWPG